MEVDGERSTLCRWEVFQSRTRCGPAMVKGRAVCPSSVSDRGIQRGPDVCGSVTADEVKEVF